MSGESFLDYVFDDSIHERVDLAVVPDDARAKEICAALHQAGLDDVKCWAEDMAQQDSLSEARWSGPFHIRVWQEDLDRARQALADSGLQQS